MATNNSQNSGFTNNADGFDISGGTTKRTLTVTGGDITLTGGATTKGDILASDGTDFDIVAVGTDGQVLTADSAQANGVNWTTVSGTGDVVGPASAVNNAPARFDTTTGKLIQSTPNATINDTGYYLVGGADGSAMVDLRIATDTLQGLRVEGDATDAISFSTFITADSFLRFSFLASGQMTWGDGTGAGDTNLYRSAANTLKTDDTFVAGTGLTIASLTGVLRADSGVVSVDSDVTDIVAAASTTAAGKVELATTAETDTGTDTGRVVTPDGLAGSYAGKKSVGVMLVAPGTNVATGTSKAFFTIPSDVAGMNLVSVHAEHTTAGTTGVTTYDINKNGTSMLSTKLTVDSAETGSDTAATAAVIDGTQDDVTENDVITIDVDGVSTTAPQGAFIRLTFQLP